MKIRGRPRESKVAVARSVPEASELQSFQLRDIRYASLSNSRWRRSSVGLI